MAESRLRIQKDLEKSLAPGAVFITDANSEGAYLPAGSNGQVLGITAGSPAWVGAPGSSFILSDGTNTQTVNAGDTLLAAAGNGMSVLVGATDTFTYAVKLSADADNSAVFGTDGGVFVPIANVVTGATWDDVTNTLTITFSDGSDVDIPIVDVVGAFLADFTISDGTNTDLINNHETVTFTGANKILTSVGPNVVGISIDVAGSTSGQVLTSQGGATSPLWQNLPAATVPPTPKKDEFSPTSGTNTVTLTASPTTAPGYTLVDIFRNGVLQQTSQYTVAGTTVTFLTAFAASTGAAYSETVTAKYYV